MGLGYFDAFKGEGEGEPSKAADRLVVMDNEHVDLRSNLPTSVGIATRRTDSIGSSFPTAAYASLFVWGS